MKFRLGYVAMTLNLEDCSPSGTVTLVNLNKLTEEKARLFKLRQVTKKNLNNTLRILKYNKALDIQVYRLTSKLVPLATHPITKNWDYISEFKNDFEEIGRFIKENHFRISAHPDHFTLINSSDAKVFEDSIKDLDYHVSLFEAMGLDDYRYKLVMHIGGLYKNKQASTERFKENFLKLPERIRMRLILENDDKSYTARDVLDICRDLKVPMVLDIHHHKCINNGEGLKDIIPLAFDTWNRQSLPPKLHFSSPRSNKDFRSHAEDIDVKDFYTFLSAAKETNCDFDVMLEAKNKDSALIKLSEALSDYSNLERISLGEFEML